MIFLWSGNTPRKTFTIFWKFWIPITLRLLWRQSWARNQCIFLDTVVYKEKRFKETGTFDTKVYFKPTDTLELLHKKSHHPNHTFKGLIKSQILRYVRICNNKQDVMIACRKLFAALVRRGYSESFLRKIKDKTLCELRKNSNKGSSQRCTTRNCKLCLTQVVVESGKTMRGVLDAGIKFKSLSHKIVIQLTVFTV